MTSQIHLRSDCDKIFQHPMTSRISQSAQMSENASLLSLSRQFQVNLVGRVGKEENGDSSLGGESTPPLDHFGPSHRLRKRTIFGCNWFKKHLIWPFFFARNSQFKLFSQFLLHLWVKKGHFFYCKMITL